MEITLKSKKKLKLKVLTQDMKDELMDSLELVGSGKDKTIKSPNKTMTKFLRVGLDCDVTDEFLASFSFEERVEAFTKIQDNLLKGEGKTSSSK